MASWNIWCLNSAASSRFVNGKTGPDEVRGPNEIPLVGLGVEVVNLRGGSGVVDDDAALVLEGEGDSSDQAKANFVEPAHASICLDLDKWVVH